VAISLLVVACAETGHYKRTPFGLGWSECTHEVPSGTHIIEGEDYTKLIFPNGEHQILGKCDKPFIRNGQVPNKEKRDSPDDGWQVWTAFNNYNNATFTSFLGSFNVPTNPEWGGEESGILYMFTGLQNDNWVPIPNEWPTPPYFDIIQPVLQYGGDSEDGGGNYWALASWYVTLDSQTLWSTVTPVDAGDEIFGNMTMISENTWYISGIINNNPANNTYITMTANRLGTQNWAYCTLEVYEIGDCSMFPPSSSPMVFNDMVLKDANGLVTADWDALNNAADHCTAVASIQSPSQVTITF